MWFPRKDYNARGDQQSAFFHSRHAGPTFCIGGNGAGCCSVHQMIRDPVAKTDTPIGKINGEFHVLARSRTGQVVVATASQPQVYGVADLYRVSLSNGDAIQVTLGHRLLTTNGWREIGDILRDGNHDQLIASQGPFSTIIDVEFLERDEYWDFSVEEHENYWMAGVWHHNTSEVMVAKVADFVLHQQPPPRKDTPFWLIAGSYEQVCNTLWKEKLLGHGHIPEGEIQWDRISWLDKKKGQPASVPLKPWPAYSAATHDDYVPGANWVLEFKSWRQGWQQMSSQSIGGFAFSEQFPWNLFQEVFRGCREYSFVGNKLAEFTPIHPDMSFELQEMIEANTLPPSWAVYRANTECALEAGHVSAQWYQDFFGMIPDEMLGIRQRGDFGGFDGTIYPSFSLAQHVKQESQFEFVTDAKHGRAIDWGSGGEHAFGCLWYYRDPLGRYWVYDEYYDKERRTTPDYLAEVDRRSIDWGWDDSDPYYGQTWADTADPGAMLMASQLDRHVPGTRPISIAGAKKNVLAGIEHVQMQLKSQAKWGGPGLFIHARCRNLIREMRTYRWLRSAEHGGLNNRAAARQPLKRDDHLCLVAGTMIATSSGQKAIEDILPGDRILSHLGVTEVLATAKHQSSNLVNVASTDGVDIVCTADHPLASQAGWWVPAGDTQGHRLWRLSTSIEAVTGFRLLNMADSNGGDIPTVSSTGFDATFGDRHELAVRKPDSNIFGYTSKYGEIITDQFRTGANYTIKTVTAPITTSAILRLSRRRFTCEKNILRTLRKLVRQQSRGTEAKRDDNGIRNKQRTCSSTESQLTYHVLSVASHSKRKTVEKRLGFAVSYANTMHDSTEAPTTLMLPASNVANASEQINMRSEKCVQVPVEVSQSVRVVRLIGQKDVYSLATSDGSYFANGVLVRNCDPLRYAIFSEASISGMTINTLSHAHGSAMYQQHGVEFERTGKRR